jgi:hypothetical protein
MPAIFYTGKFSRVPNQRTCLSLRSNKFELVINLKTAKALGMGLRAVDAFWRCWTNRLRPDLRVGPEPHIRFTPCRRERRSLLIAAEPTRRYYHIPSWLPIRSRARYVFHRDWRNYPPNSTTTKAGKADAGSGFRGFRVFVTTVSS